MSLESVSDLGTIATHDWRALVAFDLSPAEARHTWTSSSLDLTGRTPSFNKIICAACEMPYEAVADQKCPGHPAAANLVMPGDPRFDSPKEKT